MTRPKLLNRSVENQITEDWQKEIPSLGVYRPRHLLKRVGPLLVGICLDRDSGGTSYRPTFHVHCLGKEAPAVFLTLFTQLRSDRSGGPDFVQVRFHEEKYKEAAARMVRQSLLPLEGDLRLEQVIAVYQQRLANTCGEWPSILYRDMILLSAWAGDSAGAQKLLVECLQIGDDIEFRHVGGRSGLEGECRKLIEQPTLIQQTVDSQIAALGVGHLPLSNLLLR